MPKETLTIVIGSGFSSFLKMATTADLTEIVRGGPPKPSVSDYFVNRPRELSVPQALWRMASSYYNRPNFETVLHLAETLIGYKNIELPFDTADGAKPAFGAFMNPMPNWQPFFAEVQGGTLELFIGGALHNIGLRLSSRAETLTDLELKPVRDLLSALSARYNLVIATLNYDDIIERAVSVEDGFDGTPDDATFMPSLLLQDYDVFLMHLHGSIRFYIDRTSNPPTIRRASKPIAPMEHAKRTVIPRLTQSGETIVFGPMISGLRKTDKLLAEPFSSYHWKLKGALMRSSRALIIGYGGFDTYLNGLIGDVSQIHGDSTRVAFVIKHDKGELVQDFGALLPASLIGGTRTLEEWKNELDSFAGSRQWQGTDQCKLFVDGVPLDGDDIDRLLTFLA